MAQAAQLAYRAAGIADVSKHRSVRQSTAQRGLALVELLVGSAIGLWIVCGALLLFANHLRDNRRLLLEARLHHDLRAAADLMVHDLKRAGYWQHALAATVQPAASNPYRTIDAVGAPDRASITYSFSRDDIENDAVDAAEATGFRVSGGVLQALVGSNWQALTDPLVLQVTRLSITSTLLEVPAGPSMCESACGTGPAYCPHLGIRSYGVRLSGQSAADPAVLREVRAVVRVRNDDLSPPACL